MDRDQPPYEVVVVVDPRFGDQLRKVPLGTPVWITMSDTNAPVIRAIWAERKGLDHLNGVTGFNHDDVVAPEELFLGQLDAVDLHHGVFSAQPPYTVLTVVGARATPAVIEALTDLGFRTIDERESGFTAQCSLEAAQRMPSE